MPFEPKKREMTQKIALEASEDPSDPEIGELFDSLDEGSLDNLAKELIQTGQSTSSKILRFRLHVFNHFDFNILKIYSSISKILFYPFLEF